MYRPKSQDSHNLVKRVSPERPIEKIRRTLDLRSEREDYGNVAVTAVAEISDCLPLTAPPQLNNTRVGEVVEIPNVSPGHTDAAPYCCDTCAAPTATRLNRERAQILRVTGRVAV